MSTHAVTSPARRRIVTSHPTVGDFRRAIEGLPDSAPVEFNRPGRDFPVWGVELLPSGVDLFIEVTPGSAPPNRP